jgi:hypothetical protein
VSKPGSASRARFDLLVAGLTGIVIIAAIAAYVAWPGISGHPGVARNVTSRGVRSLLVGNKVCAECHPGEAALHARSGHARTFQDALESRLAAALDGQTFADPERPDVEWSYHRRDGQFVVERHEGDSTEALAIEYAIGSGGHATTFVSLVPGSGKEPYTGFEHRLTYYAHKDPPMGITPGQDAPSPLRGTVAQGRLLDAHGTLACFACHTTLTADEGKGRIVPEQVVPNISCETCHGPGQKHVEAARSGSRRDLAAIDFGPGRERAETELRFCGQCHRHPDMAPPGSLHADNRELVRFQPVGLMQSLCYRKAPDKMRCVLCHDPHAKASEEKKSYDATCLTCHSGSTSRECTINPRGDCVTCHMPKADAGQGILFTDHWIRPHDATAH